MTTQSELKMFSSVMIGTVTMASLAATVSGINNRRLDLIISRYEESQSEEIEPGNTYILEVWDNEGVNHLTSPEITVPSPAAGAVIYTWSVDIPSTWKAPYHLVWRNYIIGYSVWSMRQSIGPSYVPPEAEIYPTYTPLLDVPSHGTWVLNASSARVESTYLEVYYPDIHLEGSGFIASDTVSCTGQYMVWDFTAEKVEMPNWSFVKWVITSTDGTYEYSDKFIRVTLDKHYDITAVFVRDS